MNLLMILIRLELEKKFCFFKNLVEKRLISLGILNGYFEESLFIKKKI